jgi:hypothetical protein
VNKVAAENQMKGIELSGFEEKVRHPPLKLKKKNSCFYFAKCKKLK